jgi:hypothetical protein
VKRKQAETKGHQFDVDWAMGSHLVGLAIID